jgi:acetyl-CoA/propionyl-CoA carboxylase biotin carboxyl carrier protein
VTIDGSAARVRIGSQTRTWHFARAGDRIALAHDGSAWSPTDVRFERSASAAAGAHPELRSPMPGAVVAVFADDGALVDVGDPVLAIEAMKMEHVLKATVRGVVSIEVQVGTHVAGDQVVATIAVHDDALQEIAS